MKLAETSRLKLEQFFREIQNNKDFRLPVIYFYAGDFSQFLTSALKIQGITIGRNIFIKPIFLYETENNLIKIQVELAAHEIAHVLQFRREGFFRFLLKYGKSYWQNLKAKENWSAISRQEAYWEIPFEVQAREVATKFIEWNGNFQSNKE